MIARYTTVLYPSGVSTERTIGFNIRQARIDAGIETQTELAKRLKVPQPQLSDWENDRYGTPDVKTLLRIAAAIPCSVDALLEGIDAQYDKTRDLIRHRGDQASDPSGGAKVDAPTPTAASDLQQQYDALLAATTDVAFRLSTMLAERGVDITVPADHDRSRTRKSRVRPRSRKAG